LLGYLLLTVNIYHIRNTPDRENPFEEMAHLHLL
jgi:hypothetical protein